MPVATWWRGDPSPVLLPTPGLTVRRVTRWDEARAVTDLTEDRVVRRFQDGNSLYAAFLNGQPAGYGWLARETGRIDELHLAFTLPSPDVYLWDFVTLPAFRGRGVYPHLLQAILRADDGVDRFWIGYEGQNRASARGIEKAGFRVVGDLVVEGAAPEHLTVTGVTLTDDAGERGQAFADLLRLPLVSER
jgi:GNAT superfamily N-acetyltransferase